VTTDRHSARGGGVEPDRLFSGSMVPKLAVMTPRALSGADGAIMFAAAR